MEQESGRKRPAYQLQGDALQDQAVRAGSADADLSCTAVDNGADVAEKVVIRYHDRVVKGTAQRGGPDSVQNMLRQQGGPARSIRLKNPISKRIEDWPLANVKAVFLVKTFEGDYRQNALHFHTQTAVMQGLWVRVEFHDSEVMEGMILNDWHYVLEPGFLLIPTDPRSNNRMVYVLKTWLKNFEVLGLRNPPRGHTSF